MADLVQLLDAIAGTKVLVIGEAILDCYLDGFSSRLAPEAPVPVVTITDKKYTPGGAANTAANLHSLGAKVTFLSVIGDDWEGNLLLQVLQQHGISKQHILTEPGRQTLAKQRVIASSQMLLRFDQGSTNPISPKVEQALIEALERSFLQYDAVIVSDYGYGILTTGVINAIATQHQPHILVVDAKNLTAYRDLSVTVVKPNYQQAIQLLGIPTTTHNDRIDQITAHQKQLLDLTGAEIVAVTLDEAGAIILTCDHPPHRIFARKAINHHVSGAGDTFISALTLALSTGASIPTAGDFATAAAGVVVNKLGTSVCSVQELRLVSEGGMSKYLSEPRLVATLKAIRDCGRRIVFTNGCFDILHAGHVSYLNRAKALGDILIIGVNSDASVSRLKGPTRPINPLADRIQVLGGLGCVDYLVAFEEDTPINLIKIVCPDIYVKGGDYTRQTLPEAPLVEQLGGVVEILPFLENRSTTNMIKRISSKHD